MAFSNVDQIPLDQQIALSTASAKNQMAFQERMSNTAIQRQVADLKAAGMNPVLATKLGGASTPTGAEGDYSDLGATAVNAVVSALGKFVDAATGSGKGLGSLNPGEYQSEPFNGMPLHDLFALVPGMSGYEKDAFMDVMEGRTKLHEGLPDSTKQQLNNWRINFYNGKMFLNPSGSTTYNGRTYSNRQGIPLGDYLDPKYAEVRHFINELRANGKPVGTVADENAYAIQKMIDTGVVPNLWQKTFDRLSSILGFDKSSNIGTSVMSTGSYIQKSKSVKDYVGRTARQIGHTINGYSKYHT